jgi:ubiquinone/menaquinone biosynthesis C-methylase UbiE
VRIRAIIARAFYRARGDTGPDPSRGPLSDRVRDAALGLSTQGRDPWCLEVGVGEGLLAEGLIARGTARGIIGMDVSRNNLAAARKRAGTSGPLLVVCARGDRPPFAPGSVGRVVCINTLHNQSSWEEVAAIVRAMCYLVAAGGSLVIDIRNARDPLISLAYRFSTMIDPSTKRLPVRAYRFGRVRRLLSENGFRVARKVRVRYPFWPIPSAYVIEAKR